MEFFIQRQELPSFPTPSVSRESVAPHMTSQLHSHIYIALKLLTLSMTVTPYSRVRYAPIPPGNSPDAYAHHSR